MSCPFFSSFSFPALLPEFLLMGLGVLMLLLSFSKAKYSPGALYGFLWAQIIVFIISLAASFCGAPTGTLFSGAIHFPAGSVLAANALQAIAIVIAWMSKRTSQTHTRLPLEFYGLLSAATASLMFLVHAANLPMLFVTLEASSLFVGLMLAIGSPSSPKTALKYLIPAGLSAVMLLWGIALLYASTGTLQYAELGAFFLANNSSCVLALAGVGLVLGAFAFKLGLFPFSYYLPEVYESASYPVLGFMATAAKLGAAFALLVLLQQPFFGLQPVYQTALGALVALSFVWGALSALKQTGVKRLLSLSGVVHAAFIVSAVLFCAADGLSLQPVFFYFLVYVSAILLVLYTLVELSDADASLDSLKNSYARHPSLALCLVLAFASMAGLPPLGGFFAKFFVLYNTVLVSAWPLLVAMIIGSVIGLYYYLSLIFNIIGRQSDQPGSTPGAQTVSMPISSRVILIGLSALLVVTGFFQGIFLK